jgi:hypothetical protein
VRDSRVKCDLCRQWMRRSPTAKTPKQRAPRPFANVCTGCVGVVALRARLEAARAELGSWPQWMRDGAHAVLRGGKL